MARISGIDLQDGWKVDYALTKIKGLGWSSSQKVLKSTGIDGNKKIADLTTKELTGISKEIEKYPTEGDLLRRVRSNIQRLKTAGTYRGIRHNQSLPGRGQRTRSNARTRRGKRKTVGSFKKEELSKQQTVKK